MASKEVPSDNQVAVGRQKFCIPRPRSLGQFIIYPSLWCLPNFKNFGLMMQRIKTNLLYFQTNYLIMTLGFFALFTIMSMKTLLTGFVCAAVLVVGILFFFEHIPLARQIKQNHPSLVIIAGIVLVMVAWHASHTILFLITTAIAPLPLWFLHAALRSSEHLIDGSMSGSDYFVKTPIGQIMQMLGIEPRASVHERASQG